MQLKPHPVTFAVAQSAYEKWGANCGPAALVAVLGLPFGVVIPHLDGFERKRYTNPKMMFAALDSLGLDWLSLDPPRWPEFGLVLIQWHGAWMHGPPRSRYRRTHWVACCKSKTKGIGIFDVNATRNGTGWCALADWEREIVPSILEQCVRGADGAWSLKDAIELRYGDSLSPRGRGRAKGDATEQD